MKEVYFKIKQNCELPVGIVTYSYKDFDGTIHPFGTICMDFKEDENNIKKMEEIKQKYSNFFMFFNNSDEGIEFWNKNLITIVSKN